MARMFPVTVGIIAVNVAVYLAMCFAGASPLRPTPEQILKFGANYGPLSLSTQPWRILTCTFVHIGLLHIGFNMWCLWNLGALAERIFGRWTFLLLYLLSGIGGGILSLYWHPIVPGAGASGAIFGVAGALIAALYLGKLPIPPLALKSTLKSVVSFAIYNLIFGAVFPGIDNWAHLGGLLTGLLIGALLSRSIARRGEAYTSAQRLAFPLMAVLLFAGFRGVQKANAFILHADAGRTALARRDNDRAIRELNEALKLRPSDATDQYFLGTAYLKKDQLPEAEAAFRRAADLDKRYTGPLLQVGTEYLRRKKYQDAYRVLADVVHRDPRNADAFYQIAFAEQQLDKKEQAEAALKKSIALRPDSSGSHEALGDLYLDTKRTKEAIDEYLAADKLDPDDPDLLHSLARAYLKAGMSKEAAETQARALAAEKKLAGDDQQQ